MKNMKRRELIFLMCFLLLSGCAKSKCVQKKQGCESVKSNALVNAAEKGDLEGVKRLLKKGENIKSVNQSGWTSLNIAVYNGHIEIVKFLIEKGADVNYVDSNGWTALKIAESQGNNEMIKLLKEIGAKK